MKNNLATKMASSKEIDEQVLPAACLEFLREIKYSTNVKAILEQLQAMARMQEEQSERLDELDGRIANMATYQTVIMTLVSIMLLLMVAGGVVYNYYGTSRQAKDRYNNKRKLRDIKELLGSLYTDLFELE